MSEISELEGRITAALDRIRDGVGRLEAAGSPVMPAVTGTDTDTVAELEARLAEEQLANAQLEERVRALKERQDTRLSALEEAEAAAEGKFAQFEQDISQLRSANAELREINEKLRLAAEDGSADPELINKAMRAELDALRAVRAADANEVDAVLAELRPLIEEAR